MKIIVFLALVLCVAYLDAQPYGLYGGLYGIGSRLGIGRGLGLGLGYRRYGYGMPRLGYGYNNLGSGYGGYYY
ncbi:hypothetical protein KGM_200106 [Danaus plexippus plexippus]|uniref:Uncharacterized protein n=1 Tax=Danaus plexippus plexippus TaxID=278856 RepID=A0A212EM47_DANPL|nr:hypothetical protein KGM_200106 [Danaus plexippus plexippus]